MADIVDMANDIAEQLRAAGERLCCNKVYETHGIGICINCGVDVEGDARWCCIPCRDDWEQYGDK